MLNGALDVLTTSASFAPAFGTQMEKGLSHENAKVEVTLRMGAIHPERTFG